MKLKSLESHNKKALKRAKKPKGNGIACPHCNTEMEDGEYTLMTYPPKTPVRCPKCNYTNYRF